MNCKSLRFFILMMALFATWASARLVNGGFDINDLGEDGTPEYDDLGQGWRVKAFTDWAWRNNRLEAVAISGSTTRAGQFFDASDMTGSNWELNFTLTGQNLTRVQVWAGVDKGNNNPLDLAFNLDSDVAPNAGIVTSGGWTLLLDLVDVPAGEISESIDRDLGNYDVMVVRFSLGSGSGSPILTLDDVSFTRNHGAWLYSSSLTINTSGSGANISENLMDFPMLVRLNFQNFDFDEARSDGGDLRFTSSSLHGLPYEIESWDAASQSAVVWVGVDSVLASNSTQSINMYWGNFQAPGENNPGAVFDTANGFLGVWHLAENGGSAVDQYRDATVNGFHGEGVLMSSDSDVDALIGRGRTFDGTEEWINLNEPILANLNAFTISGWINPDNVMDVSLFGNDNNIEFTLNDSGSVNVWSPSFGLQNAPYNHSAGDWHQVVLTGDGTQTIIYVDGSELNSKSANVAHYGLNPTHASIAGYVGGGPQLFRGEMDEIRFSKTARSADWLKLSYMNQQSNSNVITMGPKVTHIPLPVMGYSTDNMIPADRVTQKTDGKGDIEIEFRVKHPEKADVTLHSIQYSIGAGHVTLSDSSAALPGGWKDKLYSSEIDFSGKAHKITIETRMIPELGGNFYDEITFRLRASYGRVGEWAQTEIILLDNEFPDVTLTGQTTPVRSPEISGISSEALSQVQITVDGITYNVTDISLSSFVLPAGTLPDLLNGTYSVSVDATDMFGNTSNQNFSDVLTINSLAPIVTVDPLITRFVSSAITGSVSENSARVDVTIGTETHPAVVQGGAWTVPAGTFQNLVEGNYNVTAVADFNGAQGVDGSSGELTIDLTAPLILMNDIITNLNSPSISGSVTEIVDSVILELNNQTLKAAVDELDWEVVSGPFTGIIEGIYPMNIQATDPAGNTGVDTSYSLVIDRTAPQMVSLNPNGIKTTLLPELRLEFNEPVTAENTGQITLMNSADTSVHQTLNVSSAQGQGTNTLTLSLVDSLEELSDYHLLVGGAEIADIAGNPYPGISNDSSWSFSTPSKNSTFVSRVTSTDSSGIYPIGKEIFISLIFTDTVSLTGGNLNITLETGTSDAVVSIDTFSTALSLDFSYSVMFGDFSRALNIISLELDSGAVFQNQAGGDVILDIGGGQNLSRDKIIGLDGTPLEFEVIKPGNNIQEQDALVSYSLSKNIASGSVNWLQLDPTGTLPIVSLINHTVPLGPAMLSAGFHVNQDLNPILVTGEIYDVTLTVTDSAGTSRVIKKTNVTIGEKISSIAISPGNTSYLLGEVVHLIAVDKNTGGSVTGGAVWTLVGAGTLDSLGKYTATSIGTAQILARVGTSVDTLIITVKEGVISIPGNSLEAITPADNLVVKPELPLGENSNLGFSYIPDSLLGAFDLVGPNIAFETFTVASMSLSIRADAGIDTSSGKSFGVYQLIDPLTGAWKWVPAEIEGDWARFTVMDTVLGSYILGQIKEPPGIGPQQVLDPAEGSDLQISYTASSNIMNPQVTFHYVEGGKADSAVPVIYSPTDTLWTSIPGQSVSTNGIVYRFEITDGTHTVLSAYQEVNVENLNDIPFGNVLLQDVYQSISIPMNQKNNLVEQQLMDEWGEENRSIWRLYKYDSNFVELTKRSELLVGNSYWFKMVDQVPEITIEAGSAESVPLLTGTSLELHTGWNTIANPYLFPVTLAQLQLLNGGSPLIVYAYPTENQYIPLDINSSLEPFKGYVLWNGQPGAKILNNLKTAALLPGAILARIAERKMGSELLLSVKGKNSSNGQLSISYHTQGARAGRDQWDLPKPASPRSDVSIELVVPWSDAGYLTDRRGAMGEGQEWNFVTRAAAPGEGLTLGFESRYSAADPYHSVLLDDARGRVFYLVKGGQQEYVYTSSVKLRDEFQIITGSDKYISQKVKDFFALARRSTLGQNFPNPFMASTNIQYQVAGNPFQSKVRVRLDVYNLKGQLVKTLVNKKQNRGHYQVVWYGRTGSNMRAPAGTYIYRLTINENVMQKKLVLLR